METIIVKVADFSENPGPRYKRQGDHSGEEFYTTVLNHKFAEICNDDNKQLVVDLDGTSGYPSSFLDQAFGELVFDFGVELVKKKLTIATELFKRRKSKIEEETYVQWETRRNNNEEIFHEDRVKLSYYDGISLSTRTR